MHHVSPLSWVFGSQFIQPKILDLQNFRFIFPRPSQMLTIVKYTFIMFKCVFRKPGESSISCLQSCTSRNHSRQESKHRTWINYAYFENGTRASISKVSNISTLIIIIMHNTHLWTVPLPRYGELRETYTSIRETTVNHRKLQASLRYHTVAMIPWFTIG